jgi:hypothetical protein
MVALLLFATVSGRRRLLSLHPHLPAVGALAYRDLLAHHPAVLRVTAVR